MNTLLFKRAVQIFLPLGKELMGRDSHTQHHLPPETSTVSTKGLLGVAEPEINDCKASIPYSLRWQKIYLKSVFIYYDKQILTCSTNKHIFCLKNPGPNDLESTVSLTS